MAATTEAKLLAQRSPKKMSPLPSLGFSARNSKVAEFLLSCCAIPTPTFPWTIAPFSPTPRTRPSISCCMPHRTGHGVRLYTAMLPYSNGDDHGPFRSWPTAQASFIPLSHIAAASVAEALKKDEITVRDSHRAASSFEQYCDRRDRSRSCAARFERLCSHGARLSTTYCRRCGERNRRHPCSTWSRAIKKSSDCVIELCSHLIT